MVAGEGMGALDYNVSHSGDWVVLAGGEGGVGVDVMRTRDSRVDRLEEFFRLMDKQFTAGEWGAIRGREGRQEQLAMFFRHWTLKESYVKAVGSGLNLDLRSLNFRVARDEVEEGEVETGTRLLLESRAADWRFEESRLDEEHAVCVCSKEVEGGGRPFTELKVQQVLALFDSAEEETAVFRPADPAHFSLFAGKLGVKPF